jgi:hypothetical protein
MTDLKAVNLDNIAQGIRNATRPVKILWQADDTLDASTAASSIRIPATRSCT